MPARETCPMHAGHMHGHMRAEAALLRDRQPCSMHCQATNLTCMGGLLPTCAGHHEHPEPPLLQNGLACDESTRALVRRVDGRWCDESTRALV